MKSKIIILLLLFSTSITQAQYIIEPAEGYTPQIGVMVDMLEDIKDRITQDVKELSVEEVDFLFDDNANSIGAIIMHLIATEAYYRVETLEGSKWTEEETELLGVASSLGEAARKKYKGKSIDYYLNLWDEERAKSLEGLKQKDDEWFASTIDEEFNYHFVWYHVLEHQANHMGQIALIKNRLPKK